MGFHIFRAGMVKRKHLPYLEQLLCLYPTMNGSEYQGHWKLKEWHFLGISSKAKELAFHGVGLQWMCRNRRSEASQKLQHQWVDDEIGSAEYSMHWYGDLNSAWKNKFRETYHLFSNWFHCFLCLLQKSQPNILQTDIFYWVFFHQNFLKEKGTSCPSIWKLISLHKSPAYFRRHVNFLTSV